MREKELHGLIEQVRDGSLSRRDFVRRIVGVGLAAPMAWQMLDYAGVSTAHAATDWNPTKRGGGGPLKALWWQGPTLLNPHFAVGTKDQDGSRLFYEPLAAWSPDGELIPILAEVAPSLQNGLVAKDGMSVTWKLKQGVTWHDGTPFTADDVVFNWEYATDTATAAVTIGSYREVTVEKQDSHTVVVRFKKPTPFWADAFVGNRGMVIPKHMFEQYMGAASRDAPANLAPVGTGPYRFVDFAPGDLLRAEINNDYHEPNKPFFDTVEVKGGGDAVSAARAVLQTGEYDYAWNLQVEKDILARLEAAGRGRVLITEGGNIEHIQINNTDPWTEVDGERSSLKSKHPFLDDIAVRQALNVLVNRQAVQDFIYGKAGIATRNFLNNPPQFRSSQTEFEFDIDKANKILDDAGWVRNSDGIREKNGVPIKMVYQTSINAPRQKTQAIIKQACEKAGIDVELKSITASVYFSSDVANPDTYTKFFTDIQMYTTTMGQPDGGVFMNQFTSWEVATQANKWQGRNITRWVNEQYDDLYKQSEVELDPIRRAALFIAMNDLVIENVVVIPVIYRPGVAAASNTLAAFPSGWDSTFWNVRDWHRTS